MFGVELVPVRVTMGEGHVRVEEGVAKVAVAPCVVRARVLRAARLMPRKQTTQIRVTIDGWRVGGEADAAAAAALVDVASHAMAPASLSCTSSTGGSTYA